SNNQKAENANRRSRKILSRFPCFHRCHIEQQIPRPVNKRRRTVYYSGKKKKRHTIKTQLMVNNRGGFIIHKLGYKKGQRRHDYDIYKKNHSITTKNVVNIVDLGYRHRKGLQISSTPNRKERNLQSSVEQKEFNQGHSKKRIVIE